MSATIQNDTVTTSPVVTVLYVADQYRRGCPSNRSPAGIGVGTTAVRAVRNCEPWNNQAPYLISRARKVLLVDGSDQNAELGWHVVGYPTGFETGDHAAAIKAAEARQWSQAVRLAIRAGLLD